MNLGGYAKSALSHLGNLVLLRVLTPTKHIRRASYPGIITTLAHMDNTLHSGLLLLLGLGNIYRWEETHVKTSFKLWAKI